MSLTLVWHSFQNLRPLSRQEITLENNGTIGRANDNDFVVHDPEKYASRYHAKVYKTHGAWYIDDQSTGGTVITRGNNDIELKHQTRPLKDGDTLTIGDCELLVQITQPAKVDTPRQAAGMTPNSPNSNDYFDIDDFVFDDEEPLYEAREDVKEIPRPNLAFNGVNNNIAARDIQVPPKDSQSTGTEGTSKKADPVDPKQAIPEPQEQNRQQNASEENSDYTGDHLAIKAFLSELNIDPQALINQSKTEVMREAGILLRTLTESMMEVLKARTSIKNTYAMDVTQIRRNRNNALKFSGSATEAMAKMLTRADGYKDPIESAEEAIKDVKAHNMAMINGLDIAIRSTIDAFAPKALEERFNKDIKIALSKNAKYWELYREKFDDIAEEVLSDNSQFAREFRAFYELQGKAVGGDE